MSLFGAPTAYDPLGPALQAMRALVLRAEGLAELHAQAAADEPFGGGAPARPPRRHRGRRTALPLPLLPAGVGGDGGRWRQQW